jgi:hypothetical protein
MSSIRSAKTFLQIAAVFSTGLLLAFLLAAWRGRRTATNNPEGWAAPRPVDRGLLGSALSKLPASFEPNRGQADPSVKFLSRGPGYALFLRRTEAVLSLPASLADSAQKDSVQGYRVLRLKLLDATACASADRPNFSRVVAHDADGLFGSDKEEEPVLDSRTHLVASCRVAYTRFWPSIAGGHPHRFSYREHLNGRLCQQSYSRRSEPGNATRQLQLDAYGDIYLRRQYAEA